MGNCHFRLSKGLFEERTFEEKCELREEAKHGRLPEKSIIKDRSLFGSASKHFHMSTEFPSGES